MFEREAEIDTAVARLVTIAARQGRGTLLTHETVRGVTGLEPDSNRYEHIMRRVRRRLEREHAIALWVKPEDVTIGYRLLTVHEQLFELPIWRGRKAARQYRRARTSVAALPDASLSLNQRRFRNAELLELAQAERNARAAIRGTRAVAGGLFVPPRRHQAG